MTERSVGAGSGFFEEAVEPEEQQGADDGNAQAAQVEAAHAAETELGADGRLRAGQFALFFEDNVHPARS